MSAKLTHKDILALDPETKGLIIRAAWEDDVPFESIYLQYGFKEPEIIKIMKTTMKPKMFIVWRERVQGRTTKHFNKMRQKDITDNADRDY